jgi:hypothetical protein
MKKACTVVVALFTALALPSTSVAQERAKTLTSPAIALATNTFDFGRIKQGDVAKHVFYFTNTGNATLEILDVKPGCGCTTMGSWDKKVEPGGTGSIPLQFNSAGFGGRIHKAATVICNVPGIPNILLYIQGEIWKPLEVSPQMVAFTFPGDGQTNQTRVVRITNNMEEGISLAEPECANPLFKTELKAVKPGREWELHVTAVAPMPPPTQLGTIAIRTSSTQVPVINVTAYASIPPLMAASPNQITLPPGPLKNPFSTKVNVRNNSSAAVIISDVEINAPGAEAKLEISRDGRYFTVNVSFPVHFTVPAGQSFELTMKTDHPKMPTLRVPVFQRAEPGKPVTTSMRPVSAPVTAPKPAGLPTAGTVSRLPVRVPSVKTSGVPPVPGLP